MFASVVSIIGVLILAPLHGCGDNDKREDALAECKYTDHELAWDEASPESIVAEDLLAFSEGEHNLIGGEIFHDGDSEILLVVDRRGENAIYRENIEGGCFSYVEVPLTVTIATCIHAETLQTSGAVYDYNSSVLTVFADLDPELLTMSIEEIIEYLGDNLPEGEKKFIRLGMETNFMEDLITGSVYIDIETIEGDPDDGDTPVSMSRMILVSW